MKIHVFLLMVMAIVCPVSAMSAICEKTYSVTQLAEAARAGEEAFRAMDRMTLLRHSTSVREEILPCLNSALSSDDAAAFHRLMALEGFTRRDDARALREFHAARKLFPQYVLSEELAPSDHPLRKLYVQAEQAGDGDKELVYPPAGGYVTVGGVRNAPRFKGAPVIVQVFDKKDQLIETRYIQAGETLPNWGVHNPLGVTAQDLGIDTRPMWTKPSTWWIVSAVAATIGAGFYGASLYEKSVFYDSATPDRDLEDLQGRTNGFGYTAMAAGGLAVLSLGMGLSMQMTFGGDDAPTIGPATWMKSQQEMEGYGHGFR